MSEPVAVAESVTSTDVPVAVDPAQLNKPVHPSAQDDSSDLLKHKLGLANAHAKQAKKEKDEMSKQLEELTSQLNQVQDAQKSAVRQNLEDQGAFRELYEQEKARAKQLESRLLNETASLKQELESVAQGAAKERMKSSAMSQISRANAVNPQQMFTLLQQGLRTDEEGQACFLNSGVEQPLGDYLAGLKQSPDWQHHFSAVGSKGMGTSGFAPSVAPGQANPYRTGNLTEAMLLEAKNPELAKALKAEATQG